MLKQGIIQLIKSFFINESIQKLSLKIGIVDDHALFRKGIRMIVESLNHSVIFEGFNGKDVIEKIDKNYLPDIILTDVFMPGMDGLETILWLKQNYPAIKVLVLGMEEDENTIIKLLKNGASGYILKSAEPGELRLALQEIYKNGFYYSKEVSDYVLRSMKASFSDII